MTFWTGRRKTYISQNHHDKFIFPISSRKRASSAGRLFACVCVLFLSGRAPAETQAVSETDEVAEQSVSVTEEKEGILSSLFSFDSFFGEDEEASEEAALTELPEAPEVAEVPEETVATAEEGTRVGTFSLGGK